MDVLRHASLHTKHLKTLTPDDLSGPPIIYNPFSISLILKHAAADKHLCKKYMVYTTQESHL